MFEKDLLQVVENLEVLIKPQALYVATDESRKRSLVTFIYLEGQITTLFILKVPAIDERNFSDFLYTSFSNGEK